MKKTAEQHYAKFEDYYANTTSSSEMNLDPVGLWGENERLRKENARLKELIEDLEDSLELASIPRFIKKVQKRYKQLVDAGLIHPENVGRTDECK